MKILIAAGIFKPELGGPATFAAEIGTRLLAAGHQVTLITYSSVASSEMGIFPFPVITVRRRQNKISNYIRYFWQMRRLTRATVRPDLVYCLDWFSAGAPAAAVCRMRGVPYIVRVGGGYIWEKYLAQGRPPMTLRAFYERGIYRQYRLMYAVIGWVFSGAQKVIFNSDPQRILFEKYYRLGTGQTGVVYNVASEILKPDATTAIAIEQRRHEIVFAGRLIVMKNVTSLVRAFAKLRDESFTLSIIGAGPEEARLRHVVDELGLAERVRFSPPLPQTELYRLVADAWLVVIPSWTDISPHQVYECLAAGVPFLLTKENYLRLASDNFLKIDPASVDDIAAALNRLTDPAAYQAFIKSLEKLAVPWTWRDVVAAHERIFSEIK